MAIAAAISHAFFFYRDNTAKMQAITTAKEATMVLEDEDPPQRVAKGLE